ncbi:MAG TPA: type II toxin-antitoxin system PemK/MazF family toxin, partial [Pyrinomonadaceae bacterium]|nr:type II toxin-antitoxin system PemK/MazF family toxin [Pyrinomonadaceae bacterium]
PDKRRPVLILTRTNAIAYLNEVTIAPITSTIRESSSSVWLDESDGMSQVCAISLDHLRTVPKNKLSGPIAHLSDPKMLEVFEAVKFALGFDK